MINRNIDSGYWDYPVDAVGSDADLRFVSFFDWDCLTVRDGRVRTAHRRVKVPRGAVVEITVTGDTADRFHLHGYDRELPITPGRPAVLRFTAGTPGVFEAELHHSGARVLELQVG